jgi:hypothetical protein
VEKNPQKEAANEIPMVEVLEKNCSGCKDQAPQERHKTCSRLS